MTERDTMRWVWRGIALAALLIGWVFITWQNHFHITAPVVIVCLAYLAVVATVYNLWRTGAAAVNTGDDEGDSTWAKPAGRLGELEREKRTLLKAIKEAEFDLQMGKLSRRDADDMIRVYRARAIEVIKDIDHLGLGAAGTAREQIMREVRARIEVDAKATKKAEPRRAAGDNGAKGNKASKAASKDASKSAAGGGAGADKRVAKASPSASDEAGQAPDKAAAKPDRAAAAGAASARSGEAADGDAAAAEAANEADAPTGAASLDDEAMDADSTTTVDSTRNSRAKEATP